MISKDPFPVDSKRQRLSKQISLECARTIGCGAPSNCTFPVGQCALCILFLQLPIDNRFLCWRGRTKSSSSSSLTRVCESSLYLFLPLYFNFFFCKQKLAHKFNLHSLTELSLGFTSFLIKLWLNQVEKKQSRSTVRNNVALNDVRCVKLHP